MKVLLLADIPKHGKKGDIVDLNPSFARNYLIPKKLAVPATASILNEIKQKSIREQIEYDKELASAKIIAKEIESEETIVKARCGQGKLFGSINSADIQKALTARGFDVDKKKIALKEPIRELGAYSIKAKLMPGVFANIKLMVIADSE